MRWSEKAFAPLAAAALGAFTSAPCYAGNQPWVSALLRRGLWRSRRRSRVADSTLLFC